MTVQKFVDVMELISEYLDDSMMDEIVSVYADKGYDSKYIKKLSEEPFHCMLHSIQEEFKNYFTK